MSVEEIEEKIRSGKYVYVQKKKIKREYSIFMYDDSNEDLFRSLTLQINKRLRYWWRMFEGKRIKVYCYKDLSFFNLDSGRLIQEGEYIAGGKSESKTKGV